MRSCQMTRSYLRISFLFILTYLLSYTHVTGQYTLSIEDGNITSIIDSLEEKLNIHINYTSALINQEQYTFSVNGTKEEVLYTALTVMSRSILQLDETTYTLRSEELNDDSKIAPQTYELQILDNYGHPLPFTIVQNGNNVLEANDEGKIQLKGYFSDLESVSFHLLGYDDGSILIKNLDEGKSNKIQLRPQNHELGEVIILDRLRIKDSDGAVRLSSKHMIQGGNADRDGLGLSQMVPGVYNSSESLNNLQIRGGPPDQTQITWNGIRIMQPSLFYGKVSSTNPLMTDYISVNKNGGKAQDNSSSAAMINMKSSDNYGDQAVFDFYTDLLYLNTRLGVPLFNNKVYAKAAYRSSHSRWLTTDRHEQYLNHSFQVGVVPDNEFYAEFYDIDTFINVNNNFEFEDISGSLHFRLHPKLQMSTHAFSFGNNLSYTQESDILEFEEGIFLKINNAGFRHEIEYDVNSNYTTSLSWSISEYNHDYDVIKNLLNPSEGSQKLIDNNVQNSKLSWLNKLSYKGQTLSFGAEREGSKLLYNDRDISDMGEFSQSSLLDQRGHEWSIFGDIQAIINPLKLTAGVRWSDYSLSDYRKFIEPRAHLSYFISDNLSFGAHYGEYHQTLNKQIVFTQLQAEDGFWYLSDESEDTNDWVNIVSNTQYSADIKYTRDNFKIQLEAFRKEIKNIWTSVFDFTYEENPYQYVNSSIKGLEFSWSYDHPSFFVQNTFNWTQDILEFDDGSTTKSPFFQPFRSGLYFSYKFHDFTISTSWNFAKGRFYSLPSEFIIENQADGSKSYIIKYDEIQTEQTRDYHRLDASVSYQFQLGKANMKTGINAVNLYNNDNVISSQYYTDYREDPIIPTLYTRKGLPLIVDIFFQIGF